MSNPEAISEDKSTPRPWRNSYGTIYAERVVTNPMAQRSSTVAVAEINKGLDEYEANAKLIVRAVNNAALFEEVKAENVRLRDEIVTWKQRAERCLYCGNYSLTIDIYNAEDGLEERCQTATCVSFGEDISIYARQLQKRFEEVVEALRPFAAIPCIKAFDDDQAFETHVTASDVRIARQRAFFCYWLARVYEAGRRDTSYEEGETLDEALRQINQVLGFAGYEPDNGSREQLLLRKTGWTFDGVSAVEGGTE